MGEFGITMMIAGNIPGRTQTLSLAIWDSLMIGDTHRAGLLAAALAALSLLLLILFHSLSVCVQSVSLKNTLRSIKISVAHFSKELGPERLSFVEGGRERNRLRPRIHHS
jgi:ABC-type spermidine/putrescine transport system permease subunit II